jgi:rhodanese-related sulfurtransferase
MHVPVISPSELSRRLQEEKIVVIDMRDTQAYAEGHITGAVPLEVIEPILKTFKSSTPFVFYEAGPGEIQAIQRATKLKRSGFSDVSVLRDGLDAWKAEGLGLETGA